MSPHDFESSLLREQADTIAEELRPLLKHLFPMCDHFYRAKLELQLKGVDILVPVPHGPPVTIDWKFRNECYEDIALEFEHQHDNGIATPGWVADESKECDLFGYVFKPTWTAYMLPRRALQRAWKREPWLETYGDAVKARNKSWWSLNCPVPIDVVLAEVGGVRIVDNAGAHWVVRWNGTPKEYYCAYCGDGAGFGYRGDQWVCRRHWRGLN